MTTLLLDLGNTALKWSTLDEPDNPHMIVHKGSTHFMEELYEVWLRMRPVRIFGCSVAASNVAFSLTKFFNEHAIVWHWVRSSPKFCGEFYLTNEYADPYRLGVDRWYAAVGAVDTIPHEPLLVVHTGTATTVDSIEYQGQNNYLFKGGRIAPGPSMMRDCLTSGISSLFDEIGAYSSYPRRTSDAITAGIIDAQIGLILRAKHVMDLQGTVPRVVLAGGAAQFIASYLREEIPNLIVRHNLVLRGLAAEVKRKEGE